MGMSELLAVVMKSKDARVTLPPIQPQHDGHAEDGGPVESDERPRKNGFTGPRASKERRMVETGVDGRGITDVVFPRHKIKPILSRRQEPLVGAKRAMS